MNWVVAASAPSSGAGLIGFDLATPSAPAGVAAIVASASDADCPRTAFCRAIVRPISPGAARPWLSAWPGPELRNQIGSPARTTLRWFHASGTAVAKLFSWNERVWAWASGGAAGRAEIGAPTAAGDGGQHGERHEGTGT